MNTVEEKESEPEEQTEEEYVPTPMTEIIEEVEEFVNQVDERDISSWQ